MDDDGVLLERDGLWWRLRCDSDPALVMQANAYLGYLGCDDVLGHFVVGVSENECYVEAEKVW
jgi:hypothetical protein